MKRVIFLDRDGTINRDDSGYISTPDAFNLFPYATESLLKLQSLGFALVIVTNQSGIARGFYGYEELKLVHNKMISQLAEKGIVLDDILIAPYHKDGTVEEYSIEHEDRKPGIGLFKKYIQQGSIKTSQSFMIGDKFSDIIFGNRCGLKTILVMSGNGMKEFLNKRKDIDIKPDFIVKDLLEASKLIEFLNKKS